MKAQWYALAAAASCLVFEGCRGSVTSRPPALASPSGAASAKSAYSGHGAGSLAPEVLAKYPVKPLPPADARAIDGMFDLVAPTAGRLSPDGKSYFFDWRVTGSPQVWKVSSARPFPEQLTAGSDTTHVVGMTPDGKSIFVSRDRAGEEYPGLYAQPSGGGPLVEIQHKARVQTRLEAVADDGSYIVYSQNDPKPDAYQIVKVTLASGAKEPLVTADGLWHVEDIRPDGRLLLRKETSELTAEIWERDPKTGDLVPVVGQGEKEEYVASYGAKEGEILLLTNKLGEYRRLYALQTAGAGKGDAKRELTPISPDVPHDVESFVVDRKRTHIVLMKNEAGFTRAAAIDAKTYAPIALPTFGAEGRVPDHVVAGASTPEGRFTVFSIDDGQHPVRTLSFEWGTGKTTPLAAPSTPEVDTTTFARASLETYPARDGTPIPVLVRRPKVCASEPCAVVVAFHGGPEGEAKPGFNVGGELFVRAGFVFVEPNVRGSDGFGRSWLHADDGPKRLDVVTDIEDASAWAKKTFASNGIAPKVGVYGGSYGGYSVLMAMTMFAGAYDAGVDVVGISDLRTFLKNTAPYRRILRIGEYGDPEKDADALAKLSPMTYLDRVKSPLLILQGATDPRVPAGEAVQIHEALAAKSVPSELMIFPDEGHGAQKRSNRVLMLGNAIAFFQRHLASGTPSAGGASPAK